MKRIFALVLCIGAGFGVYKVCQRPNLVPTPVVSRPTAGLDVASSGTSTASSADSNAYLGSPSPASSKHLSRELDPALNPYAAGLKAPGTSKRQWDESFLKQALAEGQPINFELTDGVQAQGVIKMVRSDKEGIQYVSGELEKPETGKFFFLRPPTGGKAGKAVGVIEFAESKTAYRIEPTGENGEPELWKRRLDEVVCVSLPQAQQAALATNIVQEAPPLRPDTVPDFVPPYNTNINGVAIISLQSYPGSQAVMLLDFFGGYTPTWGGVTYPAPNLDNSRIKDIWKRVAEDYMPFNINVTTDIRVFQAAPKSSRMICVFTPGTSSNPLGAGGAGVAYYGSWNWGSDTVAWDGYGYSDAKGGAEVASHEVGHTLGLGHDTQDFPDKSHTEYFAGHGSGAAGWAPIMGAGYYQPVTTWSKAEYENAGNPEDDLNVITTANNSTAYRLDDTGSSLASARYLELYSNYTASAEGVIERTADTDAFRFTTAGGAVSLTAKPVGDWANLAISAALRDQNGTLIASNNPQSSLSATISTTVAAGTYIFCVTGAGRNNPLADGFTSYASLGYYSVTGSVGSAVLPDRFTVAENSHNGTPIGVVKTADLGVNPLVYTIVSGNTSNAFAISNTGLLLVYNESVLDYETLAKNSQFPVQFELFVNITNVNYPERTELNRRVVVKVVDVNERAVLSTDGVPNYVLTGTAAGTPVTAVIAADPDAYTILNYAIISGNGNGLFSIGLTDGIVRLATVPTVAHAGLYVLTVRVNDTIPNSLPSYISVQVHVVKNISPFITSGIAWTVYDGISGSTLNNLVNSTKFPRDPSFEKLLPQMDSEHDRADGYGSVMRGYLIPPVTGAYTFYLASDDNGALLLSPDTNVAYAVKIASITNGWTDPNQWTKYASQKSLPQNLVAGQAYYIEARQKEDGGGDFLQVAWVGPHTGGQTNIITGSFLSPISLNYTPHATGFSANVRRDSIQGLRVGQVKIADVNTNQTATCSIVSGNALGIFAIDNDGWVSVANSTMLASTPATSFSLSVQVTDSGSPSLSSTATVSLTLVSATSLPSQLRREIFLSIPGGNLSDLTGNSKYPNRPDYLETMTDFDSARGIADGYGSRVRAYLVPPATGQYQFYLATDDSGMLKLSSDANPANATTIASIADGQYTDPNVWNKFPSQTSGSISLVAGQKYYIEVIEKEGSGGDFIQVAWSGPGLSAGTNIIKSAYLQPFDINAAPSVSDQNLYISQNATNGSLVGYLNGLDGSLDTLAYQIVSGNTGSTFAIEPSTGRITVANRTTFSGGSVTNFNLTVLVQDSGCGGLYPTRTNTSTVSIKVLPFGTGVPGMTHRYSFTADANDSIGTAHGVLNGGASISDGCANFDGSSGYIALPGGILKGYTNASFEIWMNILSNGDWPEVFAFGQQVGWQNNGYIAFIPHSGGNDYRLSYNPGGEYVVSGPSGKTLDNYKLVYVACVYDQGKNVMSLYTDGVLTASGVPSTPLNLANVRTNFAYLGKSLFADPYLKGIITEFRIWDVPLSPLQVSLNATGGAGLPVPASLPTAVYLTTLANVFTAGQTRQMQVYADFPQFTRFLVTSNAVQWTSSNPSVVQVSTNGLMTAVYPGESTISATFAGVTASLTVSVALNTPEILGQPQSQTRVVGQNALFTVSASGGGLFYQWLKNGVAIGGATNSTLVLTNVSYTDDADYSVRVSNTSGQIVSSNALLAVTGPGLLHRWSFNSNTGADSVGGATAVLQGTATFSGGKLQIPGGSARANCARIDIVNTLANYPSISVETWFTLNSLQDWSKLWMFGNANGGAENGLSYIEFTPRAGANGNVPSLSYNRAFGTEQHTRGDNNPALMTTGTEYHVVCIFDSALNQTRLYINGVLADTGSMGGGDITQLNANEAYLGAAVNYGDANLNGAINEVRIWNTALSAANVSTNYIAGPNTVVPLVPPAVMLSIDSGYPRIIWSYGVLEEADDIAGPWTSVSGVTSPYTPTPSAAQKFYRVRVN